MGRIISISRLILCMSTISHHDKNSYEILVVHVSRVLNKAVNIILWNRGFIHGSDGVYLMKYSFYPTKFFSIYAVNILLFLQTLQASMKHSPCTVLIATVFDSEEFLSSSVPL